MSEETHELLAETETKPMQPKRIYSIDDQAPEGAIRLDPSRHFCGFWPIYFHDVAHANSRENNPTHRPDKAEFAKQRMQEIVEYFREWAREEFTYGSEATKDQENKFFQAITDDKDWLAERIALCKTLEELRGKNIASPMPPGWPCISDALIELANEPRKPEIRVTFAWTDRHQD